MIATVAPHIDWSGLSTLVALLGGATIVLVLGLFPSAALRRQWVPGLSILTFAITIGLAIWNLGDSIDVFTLPGDEGPLVVDSLTSFVTLLVCVAGIAAILLSLRSEA